MAQATAIDLKRPVRHYFSGVDFGGISPYGNNLKTITDAINDDIEASVPGITVANITMSSMQDNKNSHHVHVYAIVTFKK